MQASKKEDTDQPSCTKLVGRELHLTSLILALLERHAAWMMVGDMRLALLERRLARSHIRSVVPLAALQGG